MARLRYVLDTNIVSLVVREPGGTLARRLAAMARVPNLEVESWPDQL